jgi:hypothetical protein
LYRRQLQHEWESEIAPAFDQENDRPNEEAMMDEEIAFDGFMSTSESVRRGSCFEKGELS